jgi:hypothetical protein
MEFRRLPKFRYFVGTTTVTVITDGGQLQARGIAVCSYRDAFDVKMGEELSYSRALEAGQKGASLEPLTRKEANDLYLHAQYVNLVNSGYKFFAEYKPVPLPRELELMGKL